GPLDQFAIAAKVLDYFVVTYTLGKFCRCCVTYNGLLRVLDLPPRSIIADHRDHGQLLAHHALELHAIQAKGAVAVQDQHLLAGTRELRSHGEASAGSQAAHGTRVEPVTRLIDVDYATAIADDITPVTHHRRILVDEVAYLAAQAHGMNGHGAGVQSSSIALQGAAFLRT